MSDTIPVVREAHAKDEARAMGRRRFEDIEVDSRDEFDLQPFMDSASYSNHVLPTLRCMAGYGDRGTGTYTVVREVALIPDGAEDDSPAEATVIESTWLLSELTQAWIDGAYAAVDASVREREVDA